MNAQDRYSMTNINTLLIDDTYSDRFQYNQINSEIKTILIPTTYTKGYFKLPGYQLSYKKINIVYKGSSPLIIFLGLTETFTINQDQNFTIYYYALVGLNVKYSIFYDPDVLPIPINLHGDWEITFSNPNNTILLTPSESSNINIQGAGSTSGSDGYAQILYRISPGQPIISATAKWLFTLSLISPKPISGFPDLPVPKQDIDPNQNTGFNVLILGSIIKEEENFCANITSKPNTLVNNTGYNSGYNCVLTFLDEPYTSLIRIIWRTVNDGPVFMNYNYRVLMSLTRIQ